MRALLALLLITTAAPAASAGNGNNEITLGSYNRALRSSSADAVTDQSLGGGTFRYGRRLDLGLVPGLQTWATVGFDVGDVDGTMFQTMTTMIETYGFSLGGRATYALHRHLAVSGRLDLGSARNALTLTGNGHEVSDSAWGATVTTAVGVDMLAFAYPAFSLGLRFDVGYVLATATALSPREAGDASKIEIEAMQASIGHLDLGGKFVAFSVISQF